MKYLIFFSFLAFHFISNAQYWGKCTFGQYTNEAVDVEVDASHNLYVVGYVTGETAFETNQVVQSALGNGDIYVAKYNASGTLIWKKTFGGNFSDRGVDLAIGPDNNIIITGQYFGTVNFDTYTINSVNQTKDIFLAKLNPSGLTLWARSEGGNMADNAYGVTVDSQNNVILTGQFQGTANIANSSFTSAIDPNTGLYAFDLFISKYSSTGTPIWSKNGFAEYDDRGLAAATDSQNNIYFTGQFSKNFLFNGQTYPNLGYNIGFLCKLSPSGQTLFFNQMKGGMTLPFDLELNDLEEVIVSGDYIGNLNYYDNNGMHGITNPYLRKIFVLKTDVNGNYTWSYSLGSNNEITAKSVSIDASKNIYVTGSFRCDLSEIQDNSTIIFNSVGYKDVFLMKVRNTGTLEYIKQAGGKMDDDGLGVALFGNNQPYVCGSFTKDFNIPSNYTNITTYPGNYSLHYYYSEAPHAYFLGDSTRNSFLTNSINEYTSGYNYFMNPLLTDSIEGQILPGNISSSNYMNDTIHFCAQEELHYLTGTYGHFGPSYNYLWNTGSHNNSIIINSTGIYFVDAMRDDGCKTERDSIFAISEPIPVSPLLTDNYGINNLTPPPYNNYHFCAPDSVTVSYTQQANTDTILTFFNGTSNVLFGGVGPYTITQSGSYDVVAYNTYCQAISSYSLTLDDPVPYDTVAPKIIMKNASPSGDSIKICLGQKVEFSGIDTLTNIAQTFAPDIDEPTIGVNWTINGTPAGNSSHIQTHFYPTTSGWYTLTLAFTLGYSNLCGLDTTKYYTTRNFYIEVLPLPTWAGTILADNLLCPNGSVFLVQTNPQANFTWSGPGIIWNNNNDSIEVNAPGTYYYSGTITGASGCSKSFSSSFNILLKQAPNILSNPSDKIICPYDSVYLYLPNSYVSYMWIGPNGDSLSMLNFCYGSTPGSYYCHIVDNEGCSLTTPPIQLNEYTTPTIFVYPDEYLCTGEQITIGTTYSGNVAFQWSNGSTASQITVTQPGDYWVTITQCGITIADTITIIDGSFSASISTNDSILCFQESTTLIGSYVTGNYEWNNGTVTGNTFTVSDPGTYHATVTNELGCTTTTNSITIAGVPESNPVIIPPIEICMGASGTLTANSPYTVSWFNTADTSLIQMGNTLTISPLNVDTTFLVAVINTTCPPTYTPASITITDTLNNFEILGDSIACTNTQSLVYVNTQNEAVQWTLNGNSMGTNSSQSITFNLLNLGLNFLQVQVSNQCYSKIFYDTIFVPTMQSISLVDDSITLCYYNSQLASINENYDSIYWNVNGSIIETTDLLVTGNITYNPISVYAIDTFGCPTYTDTLWVTTSGYQFQLDVNFANYCLGDSGSIVINTNADSLSIFTPWNTTIDTTTIAFQIDTTYSGTYIIETWDTLGCHYIDSVFIPYYNIPSVSILPDSIFCINDVFTFYFPNDTNTYFWTTYGGNTNIPILFDQNLILTVVSPQGCMQWDTLVVHTVDCNNQLPNIITPNGDGVNDYFFIDDALAQANNSLVILNRWGNTVYSASPYQNNFDGKDLVEDVYFFFYYPEGNKNKSNYKSGFLTLIR